METGDPTQLRNGSDEQEMLSFHAVFIELYSSFNLMLMTMKHCYILYGN